jgi:hypothetical protein
MYHYSPTTKGFYIKEIHGNKIPNDSVEISEQEYKELFDAQTSGKQIVPGVNGKPIAVEPQQQLTWETARKIRNYKLIETDWVGLTDVSLTGPELERWKIYRQTLRDIPQSFIRPEDIIWPQKPE